MKILFLLPIVLLLINIESSLLLSKKNPASPKESKKLEVKIGDDGHVNIFTNQEVSHVKVESQTTKKRGELNYTIHQILQNTEDPYHKILHPEVIHVENNPDHEGDLNEKFKKDYKEALERDKKGEKIPVDTKVFQNVIKSLKEFEAKDLYHKKYDIEEEQNNVNMSSAYALKLDEEMKKAKRIEAIRETIDELTERLEELMDGDKDDATLDEIDDIADTLKELKEKIALIKKNEDEMPTDELGIQIRHVESKLKNKMKIMEEMQEEIKRLEEILERGEKLTPEEREKYQQLKVDIMLMQHEIDHLVEEIENLTKLREEKMARDKLRDEIKDLEKDKEGKTEEEVEKDEIEAEKLLSEEQEDAKDIQTEEDIKNLDEKIDQIEETEENLDETDPDNKELIDNLEGEIKNLEEEESPLKEEVDEKQIEMEQIQKGVDLKHRLNVSLNPMFHGIAPILDKDYADTSDFDEISDGKEYGYKNLNKISSEINFIEETMTRLFRDLPSSKALPSPDKDFDEGIFIVDTMKNFLIEFKAERKGISKQLDNIKTEIDTIMPSLNELLNFYNIKDEYDQSLPLTKETPNKLIIESYEKITLEIEDFDHNVQESRDALLKLEKQMLEFKEISNEVSTELFNSVQNEDINEDKKYSAQNMRKIETAIKAIPDIYDIKFDFDENIFKISNAVRSLKTQKESLRRYIDTIYSEIKLDLKRVYDEDGNLIEEGVNIFYGMIFAFVIAFF